MIPWSPSPLRFLAVAVAAFVLTIVARAAELPIITKARARLGSE